MTAPTGRSNLEIQCQDRRRSLYVIRMLSDNCPISFFWDGFPVSQQSVKGQRRKGEGISQGPFGAAQHDTEVAGTDRQAAPSATSYVDTMLTLTAHILRKLRG